MVHGHVDCAFCQLCKIVLAEVGTAHGSCKALKNVVAVILGQVMENRVMRDEVCDNKVEAPSIQAWTWSSEVAVMMACC